MQGKRSTANMFNIKILTIGTLSFCFTFVGFLDSKIVEVCSYVVSSTTVHVSIWIHDCFREGYVGLMLTTSLSISYLWQFKVYFQQG